MEELELIGVPGFKVPVMGTELGRDICEDEGLTKAALPL